MELKVLITKSIVAADESTRIQLEDIHNIDEFKIKVFEALSYIDNRAHTLYKRLFEDTNLLEHMSEEEYESMEHAVDILFPDIDLPIMPSLKSGVKFEFSKLFASGEMINIQLMDILTYSSLNSAVETIWNLIDSRLQHTNLRELEHTQYVKSLDYDLRLKTALVMDKLYGTITSEQLKSRLKQDTIEQLETLAEQTRMENIDAS